MMSCHFHQKSSARDHEPAEPIWDSSEDWRRRSIITRILLTNPIHPVINNKWIIFGHKGGVGSDLTARKWGGEWYWYPTCPERTCHHYHNVRRVMPITAQTCLLIFVIIWVLMAILHCLAGQQQLLTYVESPFVRLPSSSSTWTERGIVEHCLLLLPPKPYCRLLIDFIYLLRHFFCYQSTITFIYAFECPSISIWLSVCLLSGTRVWLLRVQDKTEDIEDE